jgi:hypothetical protein
MLGIPGLGLVNRSVSLCSDMLVGSSPRGVGALIDALDALDVVHVVDVPGLEERNSSFLLLTASFLSLRGPRIITRLDAIVVWRDLRKRDSGCELSPSRSRTCHDGGD